MTTNDLNKLIPTLDRTTLSAGQYDFAADQIGMLKKTIEALYYGVSAGADEFFRERTDCDIKAKCNSLGTSLKMFFTAHGMLLASLNQLAAAANTVLPAGQQITPLVLPDYGVVEFKPDGSFLSYTPPPVVEHAPLLPPSEPTPEPVQL